MAADPLLAALLPAVPEAAVRRVVVGLNWTLVAAETGCGLAHTPPRDRPGCKPLDGAGDLTRMRLPELAAWVVSDNPVAVAIGTAALNAGFNRPDVAGEGGNGLDLFRGIAADTVVVGRFPGLDQRLPGCRVMERHPGPGDHGEEDAPDLLAGAKGLVITASALANGGVSRTLALATPGTRTALLGPGTPLAPALFSHGIDLLAGSVVTDADSAARVVAEGGAVKALGSALQGVVLRR